MNDITDTFLLFYNENYRRFDPLDLETTGSFPHQNLILFDREFNREVAPDNNSTLELNRPELLPYRDYLFDLLGAAGAASRADAASRGGSSPAPAPAPSPPENDNPDFPNSFDSITYEIDSAIGSNGLDVQNDSEVHDLAEVVGQVLDMDTGDSLELINALIETGNFTQGMTGEDMYYVLNGPRYGLLGHNAKYDDFISQWKPHDSQQSQIDELNQRIETWDGHSIAGPTNQGEPHVWHKGLALAQSLSLMMAADPFEVRSMILDLHTSGHITEDATGEDIFVLFDFNHDSIIDSSDLEHYEAHNGDVDSFHRVLMASDEDITTEEIESIINDPVLRSNPHIVQNLVDNDSVSDDHIVELLLPHDSLNESGTGFVTTPQTEEIILVVADSDRFENPDIAGAIYNSENTPPDVRSEAADILGIPPLPDPPPIGYPEEVRQGGLWHRAKEWFHHVEDAVKDDITALSGLEDDFFNQFGTAGEIAGFLQGIGVEAVEFIVMTEVIAAAAGVIASAGFTVVAAGTAVLATEIGIEELIAHIKDPDAGHLTGPVGSAIKSVVTSVAQSAKELITDLPSNISTLLESGYVLVVPDDRGERARFVNPNTEAGQTQLQRDDVKLYANQHTQDSLSDQYEFEGTTQQFKHERPFEHGDALGHFVGEAIQEVLILKDVAKLALNAGKTGVEAIVNLFKDSAAEDLGLATEITTSTGESYSPREYANLLKDHSNPSEAFNDFLKLSKDERISVLHEGYTPEVPLELQSYNFYELNQLLQNNDITARITFNSEGELEIYLKDSADLNVPEDKRAAIEQKIQDTLNSQLDESSHNQASFHWLEADETVPNENYNAATAGKDGNLEAILGGAPDTTLSSLEEAYGGEIPEKARDILRVFKDLSDEVRAGWGQDLVGKSEQEIQDAIAELKQRIDPNNRLTTLLDSDQIQLLKDGNYDGFKTQLSNQYETYFSGPVSQMDDVQKNTYISKLLGEGEEATGEEGTKRIRGKAQNILLREFDTDLSSRFRNRVDTFTGGGINQNAIDTSLTAELGTIEGEGANASERFDKGIMDLAGSESAVTDLARTYQELTNEARIRRIELRANEAGVEFQSGNLLGKTVEEAEQYVSELAQEQGVTFEPEGLSTYTLDEAIEHVKQEIKDVYESILFVPLEDSDFYTPAPVEVAEPEPAPVQPGEGGPSIIVNVTDQRDLGKQLIKGLNPRRSVEEVANYFKRYAEGVYNSWAELSVEQRAASAQSIREVLDKVADNMLEFFDGLDYDVSDRLSATEHLKDLYNSLNLFDSDQAALEWQQRATGLDPSIFS